MNSISLLSKIKSLQVPLLLLFVALCTWQPLVGPFDFWAHAAVGSWIASHARPPHFGLFIWSEPHTPWIAHSWLSQLFFFELLHWGGPALVLFWNTLFVTLVFAASWLLYKRTGRETPFAIIALSLAVVASLPRFQPRQETISALLLVIELYFLLEWQRGRFDGVLSARGPKLGALLLAPILYFAFWANLHALSAFGVGVLIVAAVCDFAQASRRKNGVQGDDFLHAKYLLVVAVLGGLAILLTPYGYHYWEAALQQRGGGMGKKIVEWRPFWQTPMMPLVYVFAELVLLAMTIWNVAKNKERRWSHVALLLLATATFFQARRMLWLSAIVLFSVWAANSHYWDAATVWRKWRTLIRGDENEPLPKGLGIVAQAGVLICLATLAALAFTLHRPDAFGAWSQTVRDAPIGAAQYLEKQPRSARIFNDYEDSSYLQWALNGQPIGYEKVPAAGRHPLFIDLLNAYPDSVAFEYLDILSATPSGLKKFAARKIDLVVLGNGHWNQPLAKYLENDNSEWALAFSDKRSRIWQRRKR